MVYTYADYPKHVAEDIVRLRDRIERSGIPKRSLIWIEPGICPALGQPKWDR